MFIQHFLQNKLVETCGSDWTVDLKTGMYYSFILKDNLVFNSYYSSY